MSADRIYACQLVRYEGWSRLSIPMSGEVEMYPDKIARVHCATAPTEALARQRLNDVVGGWCRRNSSGASFSCEKMVQRGKVSIYKNPGLGFRFKLWLKGLFT